MLLLSERSPLALGAYALAAVLALFELAILWQAVHPNVSDNYRAYYLTRTTTCLPQPVTGDYTIGTELDFRSGGDNTRENRPCGWDGPAGDGMHSIGETSLLRFELGAPQDLTLMVELTGITMEGPPVQPVVISANGTPLSTVEVTPAQTERFTLPILASAIGADGTLVIQFDYPQAVRPGPRIANTYWRSVKLTAASLTPQT
jgi:hypothetical protein